MAEQYPWMGLPVEQRPAAAAAAANTAETVAKQPYVQPKAAAEATTAAAQAEFARRQQRAAAEKAEADAAEAKRKAEAAAAAAAGKPSPEMARIEHELQTDNVLNLINTARAQIGRGLSTGNIAGTSTFQGVPILGQNATDLKGTLTGLKGNVVLDALKKLKEASPTGASGLGALSEKEGEYLSNSVAALQQVSSEEALLKGLAEVEHHYRNMLALSHGEDPRIAGVGEKYGIVPIPKPGDEDKVKGGGGGPSAGGTLTAEGKMVPDLTLAGVNAKAHEMLVGGKSAQEVRDYLNRVQPGLGDRAQNIEEAAAFVQQHPEQAKDIGVDVEKVWQPASALSQTMGEAAQTGVGAGVVGAADILTGGMLDNLTANPEETRAVMGGIEEQHPKSYLAGQIGAGVLGSVAGEGALNLARFPNVARSGLLADTAMGGVYGAGSADDPDESRLWGGIEGGTGAFLGNRIGTGIVRGAGRTLAGVRDRSRQLLDRYGVQMTPGQLLGGSLKSFEDRLSGLPLIGDAINARRREGMVGFNRAAIRRALRPIGGDVGDATGELAARRGHREVRRGYNRALGDVDIRTDPTYMAETGQLAREVQDIPAIGPELHAAMDASIRPYVGPGGRISGDTVQDLFQNVDNIAQGYRGTAMQRPHPLYDTHVRPALNDYRQSLEDLTNRQSPGTIDLLRSANRANRGMSVIDDAIGMAANQGGEYMPSQLMRASRANTIRFSGKRAAAEGRGPLFALARAGQEVLPSSIPDSGTAGRLIIPMTIGAIAGGGNYLAEDEKDRSATGSFGTSAVAGLVAMAPYSKAARTALQRVLMARRPQLVSDLGVGILNRAHHARRLTSPLAVVKATENDWLGD